MAEPVIFIAVEPRTNRDLHKLDEALQLLSSEEPTLHIYIDWSIDRGSHHEYDSHAMAFKIAASIAITEAVKKAQPVLLEPVMKVEIEVPDDCLDEVIHLLDSLRCQIDRQERSGEIANIVARVPRAEMFGFQTDLDRLSRFCSSFSMEFVRFDEVPQYLTKKIVMEHEQRKLQRRM
jgi:translation elongation factor EF-G